MLTFGDLNSTNLGVIFSRVGYRHDKAIWTFILVRCLLSLIPNSFPLPACVCFQAGPWLFCTMFTSRIRVSAPLNDGSDSTEGQNQHEPTRTNARFQSGACVHCKSLKVRCDFDPGRGTCNRCETGGFECQPRSRKKRKPAPTQEDLQERSREQDREIKSLLHRFDEIKSEAKIRQMLSQQRQQPVLTSSTSQSDMRLEGVMQPTHSDSTAPSAESACCKFFGGPNVRFVPSPDIVRHCTLYPEEIVELFQM
jgi:transcriptional regulatory protein LEU3